MTETPKAPIAGVLNITAGVMGLIGGVVLLLLGVVGGGILGATVPPEVEQLALLPLLLFVPLAGLTLAAGALAVAGGLAALQRKRWGLAVFGGVAASICCFLLGVPALILTVLAEDEFHKA